MIHADYDNDGDNDVFLLRGAWFEEKGRHPVFQRDIRGFLVDLELTDEAAAKERVLFFGGRPLIL